MTHMNENGVSDPSPLVYGDQQVDKPKKAVLGLGLLLAIGLALYGYNAVQQADAMHSPSAKWHTNASPQSNGFDTAHLAPQEDNSLR